MGPQTPNPQIATFAKDTQFKLIGKSASLRICNLRNLFTDCPPLVVYIVQVHYFRPARLDRLESGSIG